MAIILTKGNTIDLRKTSGERLTNFCVGCSWGKITRRHFFGLFRSEEDVDLDLSCVMTDAYGNMVDYMYSPLYRHSFLSSHGMPAGKFQSNDGAMKHNSDNLTGGDSAPEMKGVDTLKGRDRIDDEYITVDLTKVNPRVQQIFFFLNICGTQDFSRIPYAYIRMYEYDTNPGIVKSEFASYNVAASPSFAGMKAQVMAKLYRSGNEWKFAAIGDTYNDANLCYTIKRILTTYSKVK